MWIAQWSLSKYKSFPELLKAKVKSVLTDLKQKLRPCDNDLVAINSNHSLSARYGFTENETLCDPGRNLLLFLPSWPILLSDVRSSTDSRNFDKPLVADPSNESPSWFVSGGLLKEVFFYLKRVFATTLTDHCVSWRWLIFMLEVSKK